MPPRQALSPTAARVAFRAAAVLLAVLPTAPAQNRTAALADLSIEQLMDEPVTSVSKRETSLHQAPAAISVLTADDLRRLGITSIPEALRLVPGLDVARIGANQWAISSRGFNQQYSNKLLVLMDGRSVYTPSFGGVYWDAQDMVLEDLDRIEVIRGPGATLWGANAVNGVINIISKPARETQGGLASAWLGTEERNGLSLRYGGAIGETLHYRAYVKYFDRDGLVDAAGRATPDAWDAIRSGLRADWTPTADDLVTLQGDYYHLHTGGRVTTPLFTPPFSITEDTDNASSGGNVLARWTRTLSDKSHFSLQSYFDTFRYATGFSTESRQTADVQFEHRLALGRWHDVMWGVGYRFTADTIADTPLVRYTRRSADLHLYTAFLQDEVTLFPDRLRLILGSKFEHNDYTGWEIQPSARLLWTPTAGQTVWASAARAVSTPGRFYRAGEISTGIFPTPGGGLVETTWAGGPQTGSEKLDAYELGYRVEPARNLSVDLTAFYNVYHDIGSVDSGTARFVTQPVPHVQLPFLLMNGGWGTTYGLEASIQWKPLERWRLTANYSWLYADLQPEGGATASSPRHQLSLRSSLDLPGHLEFNTFAAYVDRSDSLVQSGAFVRIPAHLRCDAGLVWHPSPTVEIGLWGQNLFDNRHPESGGLANSQIHEIPRSVVGKVTIRF